jgi:hypothetical protein
MMVLPYSHYKAKLEDHQHGTGIYNISKVDVPMLYFSGGIKKGMIEFPVTGS